jgi:hypothetical protein
MVVSDIAPSLQGALYAASGSPKAEPAAIRWLARLALERPRTTISELQLAAAALGQLAERLKTASPMLLDASDSSVYPAALAAAQTAIQSQE